MAVPILNKTCKTVLVIDPSSNHLAYTISTINTKTNEFTVVKSGMVWTKDSWVKGKKYLNIHDSIEYLLNNKYFIVDTVVTEQYFMNFKLKSGMSSVPTVNGIIQMLCAKYGVTYLETPPPSWRTALSIKPVKDSEGKNDYKVPTAKAVSKYINVPKTIKSNITLKERSTPHDITDCLAITLALAIKNNFVNIDKSNTVFLGYGFVDELNEISKEVNKI